MDILFIILIINGFHHKLHFNRMNVAMVNQSVVEPY